MSPRHARTFAMHTRPSTRSIHRRLRQTDRRNRVSGVAWATSAVHSERDRVDVGPHSTGFATFVAGRRRGEFCASSHMRKHAQSRAEIESSRARVPYTAGCEFSAATGVRAPAQPEYSKRFRGAYGPIAQEPNHRIVRPPRNFWRHPSIGVATPDCRSPLRPSQRGELTTSSSGYACYAIRGTHPET